MAPGKARLLVFVRDDSPLKIAQLMPSIFLTNPLGGISRQWGSLVFF
jgi:hypothetical protein